MASGLLGDLRYSMSLRRQTTKTPAYSGRIWYLRQVDAGQPSRYFHEHSDDDERASASLLR